VPPLVEPLEIRHLSPDAARTINAAVPFSRAPNPAAQRFIFAGTIDNLERATTCLAAAQLYEAGDDPQGQRAVAQVVLNRLRHPAFPKSVCGVVFQGSERSTGCQFTFTCDGALQRPPQPGAWNRALMIASSMLAGRVEPKVGLATHYHTDWVVPYWSSSLDKIAAVHTHLFFRWAGWWGTPGAFRRQVSQTEPMIASLATLSPAHNSALDMESPANAAAAMIGGDAEAIANEPSLIAGDAGRLVGRLVSGARLIASSSTENAFILELPTSLEQADYPAVARTFCSGRAECRIMAWRAGGHSPKGFPVDPATLSSMMFSYIHNSESGLQRMLWNCDLTGKRLEGQCMRERVPLSEVNMPGKRSTSLNAVRTSPATEP
jgi:hypothetical protein